MYIGLKCLVKLSYSLYTSEAYIYVETMILEHSMIYLCLNSLSVNNVNKNLVILYKTIKITT